MNAFNLSVNTLGLRFTLGVILISLTLLPSCTDEAEQPPTLRINDVISFTVTTANINATIVSDGNSKILEKGVCWSTNPNPSLEGARLHKAIDPNLPQPPTGIDEPTPTNFYLPSRSAGNQFSIELFRLCANTTYYVRAYAINATGTTYSNEVSFTTKFIQQVISIKTDKLSYGLCEPILVTITNTSPKDTLVFAACQDEILEQEQILKENEGFKTMYSYLCFFPNNGSKLLFPLQSLSDKPTRNLTGTCATAAGTYQLLYSVNTTAQPECFMNINQSAGIITQSYQLVE